MTKRKKGQNYVDNKRFYRELCEYHQACKVARRSNSGLGVPVPDYVAYAFMAIAENLGKRANFGKYGFLDEMKLDAIENCIVQAQSFDPEIGSNPHAYFTAISWNAFVRRIKKERKQQYIKYKNYEKMQTMDELAGIPRTEGNEVNDISDEFVKDFEDKLQKKPKPAEDLAPNKRARGRSSLVKKETIKVTRFGVRKQIT